jgi:hypothetical protein
MFDINALDRAAELNEIDEQEVSAYQDELIELFAESPEGRARLAAYPEMGFWVHVLLEYGYTYLGVTPPSMTRAQVKELLSEILPSKVSVLSSDSAADAMPELTAFWEYLQREYHLPNAPEILGYLSSVKPKTFGEWMTDPARYGMAKSFVMAAQAEGYDVTDSEAMDEFMASYNARILGAVPATGLPGDADLDFPFVPDLPFPLASSGSAGHRGRAATAKSRRKMAAASRKKNRRRK